MSRNPVGRRAASRAAAHRCRNSFFPRTWLLFTSSFGVEVRRPWRRLAFPTVRQASPPGFGNARALGFVVLATRNRAVRLHALAASAADAEDRRSWKMNLGPLLAGALLALLAAATLPGQTPFAGKPEAGLVRWEKNFEAARERAVREKKPLFVFFQEIPG